MHTGAHPHGPGFMVQVSWFMVEGSGFRADLQIVMELEGRSLVGRERRHLFKGVGIRD